MDDLRQTGLLKNLGAMDAYCWQHGGSITEDRRSYGYIAETENYRFCLRCTPFPGEYQGYLYCYDLCQQEMYRQEHPVVGRVTFASGEQQEFTDSKALLQAIREELPFRSTTGFRFETLTDDPEVKKAVDDILLDFAGEDNSRRTCNYGLTETGKQALSRCFIFRRITMNRVLRIDEEKPEMHISVQGYKVTLCFAEKENPEVAVLVKQALLSAYAMPQK